MSAEAIARVVADLKTGRFAMPAGNGDDPGLVRLNEDTVELAQWADVIDATPVFNQFLASGAGKYLYEDHLCRPVWDNALVSYVNTYGNVYVLSSRVIDNAVDSRIEKIQWGSSENVVDWDRVKWVMHVVIYMGGLGKGKPVVTAGPLHCWRIAIYPDGEISDINWVQVNNQFEPKDWMNQLMVLLDTYNLGNCVNVELAVPHRQRAQARRLERTGVTVNEIHVRPVSKSYRGKGTPLSQLGSSPLTSVRGHTAEYGTNGKGKLFGKLTGRFWIPQHIRGSEANGIAEHEYVANP